MSPRDQRILADSRRGIPYRRIAEQVGLSGWGVVLVLRRHGETPVRVDAAAERRAVEAEVHVAMSQAKTLGDLQQAFAGRLTANQVQRIVMQRDPRWIAQRWSQHVAVRRRDLAGQRARLREALASRGRSLCSVARAAGITIGQPHMLLHDHDPGPHLAAFAAELQVPVEWLMSGSGRRPPGIDPQRAKAFLAERGWRLSPQQRADRANCEAAIRRWVPQGWTLRRIADSIGKPYGTVKKCAQRLGIRSSYHHRARATRAL